MQYRKRISRRIPVVNKLLEANRNLTTDKGILQLEKGQLEADIRQLKLQAEGPREFLSYQFIRGSGIEIGAAQQPLKLPKKAKVKYVDVFSDEDLRKTFPVEYKNANMVKIDVVDDAEKLTKFKASSLDFIIANHFLEHCLDPIGTILNMYTKLRKGGLLYMAIPDMRYTFDRKRPLTKYSHLLEEHKDKTKRKFREEHTYEAVSLANPLDANFRQYTYNKATIEKQVQETLASDFRIHYHVWTQKEMTEMFVRLASDFKVNLEIEALVKNRHEVIYILRKEPSTRLK